MANKVIVNKKIFIVFCSYDFIPSGYKDTKEEAEEFIKNHPRMDGENTLPFFIIEATKYLKI